MRVRQSRLWALVFSLVALVALVLLSTGLSELDLLPGESFALQSPERESSAGGMDQDSELLLGLDQRWLTLLSSAMLLLTPIAIIYFFLSKDFRRQVMVYLRSLLLVFTVAFLIIRSARQCVDLEEFLSRMGEPSSEELAFPEVAFVSNPPQWLSFVIALSLLLLLVGMAWYVGQRFRPASTAELIAQEAQETLEALHSGDDLKDTVIRCYFDMSQILRRQRGIRREQGVTPREFEQQLEEAGLPGEYIRRLTRLFEGVRYGASPPGEREEQEAIACLTAIAEAVGGRP